MPDKFKGKYRNGTARLPSWDYGSDGAYFITICTKDREHHFGKIENDKMHYSPAGALAYAFWDEIRNHTKNLVLGEFVVMPNHIHGILILDGNGAATDKTDVMDDATVCGDDGIVDGDDGIGDGDDQNVRGDGGIGDGDGENVDGLCRIVACNDPTKWSKYSEPSKRSEPSEPSDPSKPSEPSDPSKPSAIRHLRQDPS